MHVISVLISSPSFWVFLFVNALGGSAVAIGLWGEGWAENRKFPEIPGDLIPHVSDAVRRKRCKRFFEKLLLGGVIFEVVAAVITTVYSSIDVASSNERASKYEFAAKQLEAQIEQTRNKMANIEPLNRPASDISAVVTIISKSTFDMTNNIRRVPGTLSLCNNSRNLNGFIFSPLFCDEFPLRGTGSVRDQTGHDQFGYCYEAKFREDSSFESWDDPQTHPPVKVILDNTIMLRIFTLSIPHDAEIVGGWAEITVNGTFRKNFKILPQKTAPISIGQSVGFTFYATNDPDSNRLRQWNR